MNVLVYGAGAVGVSLATCLLKSKVHVDLVARGESLALLSSGGIERHGVLGSFTASTDTYHVFPTCSDIPQVAYDFVLICTKAFDLESAVQDLANAPDLMKSDTEIALFQNGWGSHSIAEKYFPKHTCHLAANYCGFRNISPNVVEITACGGDTFMGPLNNVSGSRLTDLCDAITSGDIPCKSSTDIVSRVWGKMLYNCSMNPLTAILNATSGDIENSISARAIIEGVVNEIFAVTQKAEILTSFPTPKSFLTVLYENIMPISRNHTSSMLQDLRANRPTEIDVLNGAVVKLGKQVQEKTPFNSMLAHMIRFLQHRLPEPSSV